MTITDSSVSPTSSAGERRRARQRDAALARCAAPGRRSPRSSQPDPRVEARREQVGHQVDEHDADREHERDRPAPSESRGSRSTTAGATPEPVEREDVLDDHGAADQVGDVEAEQRERRDHRVARDVPDQHAQLAEAVARGRRPRSPRRAPRACRRAGCARAAARSRTTAVKPGRMQRLEVAEEARAGAADRQHAAGCTAKISIRTIPNQNAGMPETEHRDAADRVVGAGESRREARRASASGTVIRTANSVAIATSAAVSPMRLADQRDRPTRRRRRRRPSRSVHQIADVAHELAAAASGRAPSVAFSAAIAPASRARRGPARAGSPGTTCSSRNVAAATPITTISAAARATGRCSCARASAQPDVLEPVRAARVDREAVDLRARRVDVGRIVERDERRVLRDDRLDLRVERGALGRC